MSRKVQTEEDKRLRGIVNKITSNNVRRLRRELFLTQQEFADEVGVTKHTIWRIESGNAGIGHGTLNKIHKRFGIPFWEFYVDFSDKLSLELTSLHQILLKQPDEYRKWLLDQVTEIVKVFNRMPPRTERPLEA